MSWQAQQRFQFHAGSIRGLDALIGMDPKSKFQFHAGSIRGVLAEAAQELAQYGFNSTLVRLEVDSGDALFEKKHRFNSTLVRLEDRPRKRDLHPRTAFQFHAGSIRGSPRLRLP